MGIALEQLSGTARSFVHRTLCGDGTSVTTARMLMEISRRSVVLTPGILVEQEKEVSHSDNYRNHGVA